MTENKEYLINQCIVIQSRKNAYTMDVTVSCIVRFVEAKNQEEAIGKFITQTASLEPTAQRMPIQCYESKDYVRIK